MIRFPSVFPPAAACLLALGLSAPALHAADDDLRIVPQLVVGTAGVEPGVALEWRSPAIDRVVIRPELLLSEDQRLGGGLAVLFDVGWFDLPHNQTLSVGPRFVSHNSDDTGWEVDALATYSVAVGSLADPGRHSLGVLGAIGLRDDKRHDDTEVGASAGLFYAYRF